MTGGVVAVLGRTGRARARAILDGPDRAFGEWRKVKPRGAAEPAGIIRQVWTHRLQAMIFADGGSGAAVMPARGSVRP